MFDVGFSELIVIALVALVVLGPERLPKVARTVGHLLGRLQRYVNDVKSDINREIQLDELRKLQSEVQESARSMETSIHQELRSVETSLNEAVESGHAAAPAGEIPHDAAPAPIGGEAVPAEPDHSAQLQLGFDAHDEKKVG